MKMNYEAEEERAIQIREFFKEDDLELREAAVGLLDMLSGEWEYFDEVIRLRAALERL